MKSLSLAVRPLARADIDDQRTGAGDRFLDELALVFKRLTQFPELGQRWETLAPDEFGDVRRVVLGHFRYLIFYRVSNDAVTVLRVLHHSQDIAPALDL